MEQWISVLALSTQWDMIAIRAKAIKNLRAALTPDNLHPHKLLNLGQTYHVDEWVLSAILFFIMRKEPMGPNDSETIGVENAFKIASLRECCVQDSSTMFRTIRVLEERPRLIGSITDMKRVGKLFGLQTEDSSGAARGRAKLVTTSVLDDYDN